MQKRTHSELMKIGMSRPSVRREYKKLAAEFAALNKTLKSKRSKLS